MEEISNQGITKREMRLLKRQRERQVFLRSVRRQKIKKISIIVLAATFLVGGAVFLTVKFSLRGNQNSANIGDTGAGAPKMEINPVEYDFGDVFMAGGVVKKTFEIKNSGAGDLKIDSIWTSCHCTTAVLKVGDKISPEFGMQTGLSFWSEKIAPGETGSLEVAFDPGYHGHEGMGPAIRVVYLSTNIPDEKQVEVRLIANVTS